MAQPIRTGPPVSPGVRFEREIKAAMAEGHGADEMLLALTLMDASKLKRDPQLALTDIGFSEGRMRFLGVPVIEGGVRTSELRKGADAVIPVVEEPVAPVKPKRAAAKKPTKKALAEAAAAEAAAAEASAA